MGAISKQIPFASAQAATGLARLVQMEERAALSTSFHNPNAFTKNAFAIIPATKATQFAEVFAKDRQAAYLMPSETQGIQVLGAGKRISTPVDISVNASGDITRGRVATLFEKAQQKGGKYFVGPLKNHGTAVNGLWQRMGKGGRGGLKLLVAFTRPVEVKSNLDFVKRAALLVDTNFAEVFGAALKKALRTAK